MMEASTKGYSAEQVATGCLDDGKEVIILYVKEFSDELQRVRDGGKIEYYYTWSYLADSDAFVLYVSWENKNDIAIVFPPKQHYVVEALRTPKEIIVTGLPINTLVENAQAAGQEFVDLDGPVVRLEGVIFKDIPEMNN